jgi:hypothetical protein
MTRIHIHTYIHTDDNDDANTSDDDGDSEDDDADDDVSVSTAGASRGFRGDGRVTVSKLFKARHFKRLYSSAGGSTAGSTRGDPSPSDKKGCPTLQKWFDALKILGVNHHVVHVEFVDFSELASTGSDSLSLPRTFGD